MQFKNHKGYWGIQRDVLYWGETLEDLKLRPSCAPLEPDKREKLLTGSQCMVLIIEDSGGLALFLYDSMRVELSEEYEMLQILLKSVVIGIAPKIVELVSDGISEAMTAASVFLDGDKEEPAKPEEVMNRKLHDTTKLTQYMYDFIIYTHTDWKNFNKQNPQRKKSMDELVDTINAYMGTSKSRTSLGRVWNGQINREDLPAGKAYFDYPRAAKTLV